MSHINNSPALQIITFQVRLNTGRIINEPIENIQELSNIIRLYGLGIIAKISFYFRDNRHQFHNLILRKVMNCIRGLENLDSQLGKHIIDPFYYPQIVS